MTKYQNRIVSEFEDILMELSKNASVTYNDAFQHAVKYTDEFACKKKLSAEESQDVLDICKELIQDWFPDTSGLTIRF